VLALEGDARILRCLLEDEAVRRQGAVGWRRSAAEALRAPRLRRGIAVDRGLLWWLSHGSRCGGRWRSRRWLRRWRRWSEASAARSVAPAAADRARARFFFLKKKRVAAGV
jgi:hypothetical protein